MNVTTKIPDASHVLENYKTSTEKRLADAETRIKRSQEEMKTVLDCLNPLSAEAMDAWKGPNGLQKVYDACIVASQGKKSVPHPAGTVLKIQEPETFFSLPMANDALNLSGTLVLGPLTLALEKEWTLTDFSEKLNAKMQEWDLGSAWCFQQSDGKTVLTLQTAPSNALTLCSAMDPNFATEDMEVWTGKKSLSVLGFAPKGTVPTFADDPKQAAAFEAFVQTQLETLVAEKKVSKMPENADLDYYKQRFWTQSSMVSMADNFFLSLQKTVEVGPFSVELLAKGDFPAEALRVSFSEQKTTLEKASEALSGVFKALMEAKKGFEDALNDEENTPHVRKLLQESCTLYQKSVYDFETMMRRTKGPDSAVLFDLDETGTVTLNVEALLNAHGLGAVETFSAFCKTLQGKLKGFLAQHNAALERVKNKDWTAFSKRETEKLEKERARFEAQKTQLEERQKVFEETFQRLQHMIEQIKNPWKFWTNSPFE